jgi:TatD DNase family protein
MPAPSRRPIPCPLFDTHCHLDDDRFEGIRDEVIARAVTAGVTQILTVGVTAATSRRSVELAGRYPELRAAVGIQPNYVAEVAADEWDQIVQLADQDGVVALGETGLDRYWDHAPFSLQQDYFDRHLQLSQERDLPFIVHMRDCDADVLAMLHAARRRGPLHGVMHSFTGQLATMQECVELGMHISFAGMVTYKKSEELRRIAEEVPAERMLIETDAPYLSPHPQRSQRPNEPALLVHTAACLAEVRGISLETFASTTTANARRLFRTPA